MLKLDTKPIQRGLPNRTRCVPFLAAIAQCQRGLRPAIVLQRRVAKSSTKTLLFRRYHRKVDPSANPLSSSMLSVQTHPAMRCHRKAGQPELKLAADYF